MHAVQTHPKWSSLQLHWHRYYDPAAGRWLSEDPIRWFAGDVNLYRYVGNNPISNVDRTGLDWLRCMAQCVEDNDPIGLAVGAAIAQLAVGLWPKSMFAAIAEVMGDARLAHAIRCSEGIGGSTTTLPQGLQVLLGRPQNQRLAWKALTQHASRVCGPILIAYGLALAAVETHCVGFCTAAWWYGVPYTREDGNILSSLKEYYFS